MAQKRRKTKHRWVGVVLFYLLFPIVVWLVAFLIWFNWAELSQLFTTGNEITKNSIKRETKLGSPQKVEKQKAEAIPEKILDEDRRKLEDILKQRR